MNQARYLYSELASAVDARKRCASASASTSNNEWFDNWTETIEKLVKQHLPHGSGFDSGTTLDLDSSHADKLVFNTSFHHMNENGYYDGWTEHTVTVTPSLQFRYHIRVSGRNRNDIKDLIHESFDVALSTDVTYDLFADRFPEFKITSKWENPDGTPSQSSMVWYASDGTRFTSEDRNATNTYDGSPYERARAYAAKQMTAKQYAR
jgi:hypothetical protein